MNFVPSYIRRPLGVNRRGGSPCFPPPWDPELGTPSPPPLPHLNPRRRRPQRRTQTRVSLLPAQKRTPTRTIRDGGCLHSPPKLCVRAGSRIARRAIRSGRRGERSAHVLHRGGVLLPSCAGGAVHSRWAHGLTCPPAHCEAIARRQACAICSHVVSATLSAALFTLNTLKVALAPRHYRLYVSLSRPPIPRAPYLGPKIPKRPTSLFVSRK